MGTSFQPARAGQANSDVTYSCGRPEHIQRLLVTVHIRFLHILQLMRDPARVRSRIGYLPTMLGKDGHEVS